MSQPSARVAKPVLALLSCIALLASAAMAAGPSVAAHFYLQKDTYGVGEPVFLYLEFQNRGKAPVWYDGTLGCGLDMTFQVTPAEGRSQGWPPTALSCFILSGTSGPDCFSTGDTELKPGAKHIWRELVNGPYLLDDPGTYTISAHGSVGWSHSKNPRSGTDLHVTGNFTIATDFEGERELKDAFAPLVNELSSPKRTTRWLAVSAITDLAPPFLESTIIDLSRNQKTVYTAVAALRRLGTPAALARLVSIARQNKDSEVREAAIENLALTHNKAYLPVLAKLTAEAGNRDRTIAIQAAGLLGGKDAVPILAPLLSGHESYIREAAIRGLVRAGCREAVAPLVSALVDPDPGVRAMARLALAQLTHRSATNRVAPQPGGRQGASAWPYSGPDAALYHPALPPRQVYLRWVAWWTQNGTTAPIYGLHQCATTKPLN